MIKKIINYVPSIIVPLIINFLLILFYAQRMSPEEYGLMNIYMNTIALLYALSLSSFQSSSFRFYSIKEINDNEQKYISTYVFSNIIFTLIIVLFMLIINVIFIQFNVLLISISIMVNGLYQFFLNLYRLKSKHNKYTITRILASLFSFIFFVIIVYLVTVIDYKYPIIGLYGAYSIIVIFELLLRYKYIKIRSISFDLIKKSLIYGIPMIGVSVMSLLISYSDQYLILFYLGERQVGFYSLGYRVADTIISNITLSILLVMTPILMKTFDNNEKLKSENILSKIISFDLWIILPIASVIIIYSNDIILKFFTEYNGAQSILSLVLVASIFHSLSMFTIKSFELMKQTKKILISLIISTIVNLLYNLIFIPMYGITAAAHSSILSYIAYNILLIVLSKSSFKVKFEVSYLSKVVLLNVILIFLALFIKNYWRIDNNLILFLQLLICSIFYILGSLSLKLVQKYI